MRCNTKVKCIETLQRDKRGGYATTPLRGDDRYQPANHSAHSVTPANRRPLSWIHCDTCYTRQEAPSCNTASRSVQCYRGKCGHVVRARGRGLCGGVARAIAQRHTCYNVISSNKLCDNYCYSFKIC